MTLVVQGKKPFSAQQKFEPSAIIAVPRSQWPWWACKWELDKGDEDHGVGDTVRREIGEESSKLFKAYYQQVTGQPCRCGFRQETWNRQYPYPRRRKEPACPLTA